MRSSFKITHFILLLITACSPAVSGTPLSTPMPSATSTLMLTPTETVTPTVTPVPFSLSGNFAFTEEDKIFIYSVDGKMIRTIQTEGWVGNYEFSQQGKWVAYSGYNKDANDKFYFPYGLRIIGLEDNQEYVVVDGNIRVLYILFDEANDRLLYLTLDGLYSISLDEGMKKENLVKFPNHIFERPTEAAFEIYPSSDYHSFTITENVSMSPQIFNVYFLLVDQKTIKMLNDAPYNGSARNILGTTSDLLPSPDGRYLLIKSDSQRNDDIFLIDILDTAIVGISKNFNCGNIFSWAPDGKHFLCGIQIFDIEDLMEPKLFDSSLLSWSEGGNNTIIFKGNRTPFYKQILAGDPLGENSTILYTSKYFIPLIYSAVPLSPNGKLVVFQEVFPSIDVNAINNRTTNTVMLNTEDLIVKKLLSEKGVGVDEKLIWLMNSKVALLEHSIYDWVDAGQPGAIKKSYINSDLYLISIENTDNVKLLHSGYPSYFSIYSTEIAYFAQNNKGQIVFIGLNSSDTNKPDRYSVFVFDGETLSLKEVAKITGPQYYSEQWIE